MRLGVVLRLALGEARGQLHHRPDQRVVRSEAEQRRLDQDECLELLRPAAGQDRGREAAVRETHEPVARPKQSIQVLNVRLEVLPLGRRAFSLLFARRAPYFRTVRPRVRDVRPHHAELVIGKRRAVENHLGTVHAIAMCNGLEMAMGGLAESTIPGDKRWIPKGMSISYTAKATGDVTCIAETDQAQWDTAEGDLPVRVRGVLADGTVVIEGTITLWVTSKKK